MRVSKHIHPISLLVLPVAAGLLSRLGFGQVAVRGQVLDANSQRAIPYVSVMRADSPVGVSSDGAGRFALTVPDTRVTMIFRHINYEVRTLSAGSILRNPQVFLQPRVIPLPAVEVEARRERLAATSDLPLVTGHILRPQFDLRGFVDAGDLLHTAPSVQVDEMLSGRKTVSIRGGNADDVAVLFQGIRLNSAFDNVFDLSLIDLADVEQVELIRGSNAALHGGGAFSGVINLVPRLEETHTLRLYQRVGTYDAGTWGLSVFGQRDGARMAAMYRESGSRRYPEGSPSPEVGLRNSGRHFTLHGRYAFDRSSGAAPREELSALYLHVRSEYENLLAAEAVAQTNELLGAHYSGALGALRGLELGVAHHRLQQRQQVHEAGSWLDRQVRDQALQLEVQKRVEFPGGEGIVAYQRAQDWLDFRDRREMAGGLERAEAALVRTHHTAVGIARLHLQSGSARLKAVNFDLALRHEHVADRWRKAHVGERLALGTFDRTTLRCGVRFSGSHGQFAYEVLMNIGSNVRFPSLAQVISGARFGSEVARLLPEHNRGVEVATSLARDLGPGLVVQGWELGVGFFQNDYGPKLREYVAVGIPVSLYDMVPTARISGFEVKAATFLLRKKITVEGYASRVFISEHAAFPFHAEVLRHLAVDVLHAGYALRLVWFAEGPLEGWVRDSQGNLAQMILGGRSDVDLHAQKSWDLWRLRVGVCLSLRNVLNRRDVLCGLALRDRRYYLTASVEY